ncbi:MAG: Hydrolase 4 protein [Candidatus Dadabacteria bacterium]|nr:Hydrolase 4 protein [Candidatus Dadabacteria bacterium]
MIRKNLISFQTKDSFQLDALLLLSSSDNKEDIINTPIILYIHGVLGHFLARGTPRLLPQALLEHGINSFSVNTRMAFMGQIMGVGIFDDIINDIDASLDLLKKEGFSKIFILGYSLGANLVAYYASKKSDPCIHGLILEGCAFSLPEAQKKRWDKWNSEPSYDEVYRKAKEILEPDPYKSSKDQIFIVYRAWGPTFNPFHIEIFTYKTWWFMRGPEAHNAIAYKLISKIKAPILFLQGENDDILEPWESKELANLVREAGNSNVTVKYIPKAMHDCMENPDEIIKAIVDWISQLT